LTTTSL